MKLLFDENLSFKLARNLADLFPGSAHVRQLGLDPRGDWQLWMRARADEFAIVTKDEDLPALAFVKGHPPKIIWIKLPNCSTGQIESLIRWRVDEIRAFLSDDSLSVLSLS